MPGCDKIYWFRLAARDIYCEIDFLLHCHIWARFRRSPERRWSHIPRAILSLSIPVPVSVTVAVWLVVSRPHSRPAAGGQFYASFSVTFNWKLLRSTCGSLIASSQDAIDRLLRLFNWFLFWLAYGYAYECMTLQNESKKMPDHGNYNYMIHDHSCEGRGRE